MSRELENDLKKKLAQVKPYPKSKKFKKKRKAAWASTKSKETSTLAK